MTMDEADHVQWLRREAGRVRKLWESLEEGKRGKAEEKAARIDAIADALQLALGGMNAEMTGGFRAAAMMMRPGSRVGLTLMNGSHMTGTMGPVGKYDFIFVGDDGRRLLVAKHGVLFWEAEVTSVE